MSLHALAPTPHERHGGETFVLEEPGLSQLVRGENVLAIQAFNNALGSSDLTLNASLKGILASNELENHEASLEELLSENELAPDWDSGSKRKRLRTIRILPDAVDTTLGSVYRIRVRYEDQDRSWSAWSEPVEIRIGKREGTHGTGELLATR